MDVGVLILLKGYASGISLRGLKKGSPEGPSPFGRGLGVSPRFLYLPRSFTKGAGDTGGEGFEIPTYMKRVTVALEAKCKKAAAP